MLRLAENILASGLPNLPLAIALATTGTCVVLYRILRSLTLSSSRPHEQKCSFICRPAAALEPERMNLGRSPEFSKTIADKAIRNIWSIQPGGTSTVWPDVKEELDCLWGSKAVTIGSWHYFMHSLFTLQDLTFAHRQSGDNGYIELGKQIILSWIRCNPKQAPPSSYSWSDHTTANRAMSICSFMDYWHEHRCSEDGFEGLQSQVGPALFKHGTFLAHPQNYSFTHNHGIFQDYGLIVIASHLDATEAETWIRLAKRRLLRQIESGFSDNGVHLENSPFYQIVTAGVLRRTADYMKAADLEVPEKLAGTLALAEAVIPSLVMPDGNVVPVGDSGRGRKVDVTSGEAKYSTVYPQAGYAIIRGPWYVFLTASNNSEIHKHCDDLSLVVGDGSGRLLTDPGLLNYEPTDPRRIFANSWAGHNCVTTASENPEEGSLSCGIEGYGQVGDCTVVQGRSVRKGGIVHARSIVYDGSDGILLVIDDCKARAVEEWQRSFHFEPKTEIEQRPGGSFSVRTAGGSSLNAALWPSEAGREVVIGRQEPMQGWVAEPLGDLVEAPAIVENLRGRRIRFFAAFGPGQEELGLEMGSDGKIEITSGTRRKTVRVLPRMVEVETRPWSKGRPDGEATVQSVALVRGRPRHPFKQDKAPWPLGWQGAAKAVLPGLLAWLIVLLSLILFPAKLQDSWVGLAVVVGWGLANVFVLWKIWPRLCSVAHRD